MIGLNRISKRFGDTAVLREVSVSIGPGVTGLLGPNGAGKSTLLKILLGLLQPSGGDGQVLGLPLATHSRAIREKDRFHAGGRLLPTRLIGRGIRAVLG